MEGQEIPTSINKEYFVYYLFKKISNICKTLTKRDVYHIVNVLFEEILNDIKLEKKLKIFNFADLFLVKTPFRRHFCYHTQSVKISGGFRKLRFDINEKIRKKLLKNIDIRSIDGYDEKIDKKIDA